MAFNLIPTKWWRRNDGSSVSVRQEQGHPLFSLQREMNRMFEEFFHAFDMPVSGQFLSSDLFEGGALVPKVDLHESDKQLRISVELPGMTEKDVEVSLAGNAVTISGEKRQEIEENVKGWYRMERSYGSFQRTIPLPCEIEPDKVEAHFKNGVLNISLPKTAQAVASRKSIPIRKA